MKRILSALTCVVFASALDAQTIVVKVPSGKSIVTAPTGSSNPQYDGKYVEFQTDFGFLWADTQGLIGGFIAAQGKCVDGYLSPAAQCYPIGDCWGVTDARMSGGKVEVRNLNGQCNAQQRGCPGAIVSPPLHRFFFTEGSFAYLGDSHNTDPDIPNSTQKSDLLGRTWAITCSPATITAPQSCTLTASGGATPTPTPTVPPTLTPTPTGPQAPTATPYLVCIPVTATPHN